MLPEFFTSTRDAIIARARLKARARASPRATEEELMKGMPLIVDHVIETLQFSGSPRRATRDGALNHGKGVLRAGLSVSQVVHDYEHVHQAATELAVEQNSTLTANDHDALDHAMAQAVTEYVRLRDQSIVDDENERVGFLVHELRNQLTSATLSFGLLKGGSVSINGSTATLHERSLRNLGELIASSLAEVRLESAVQNREQILVGEFMEEIEIAGNLHASVRGVNLIVAPVDTRIAVEANRLTLASAVVNLLQNAFKFSRARGTVRLFTHATDERVFIDVEDECGGLDVEEVEDLFRPYSQRSADRSGLGLGLAICRRSVRASGGEIHVRDLPGRGCVFSVDLPRQAL